MRTEHRTELMPFSLNEQEINELTVALDKLESERGVLLRLADFMGGAVGHAFRLSTKSFGISTRIQNRVQHLANNAIQRAFDVAILGMGKEQRQNRRRFKWRDPAMQAVVAASGAVGGFAGIGGMLPDISFTTLALMREIAYIAQQEGEDLSNEETRRACLEVFALRSFGNFGRQGEESELGFFSARVMLRGRPMVLLMAEVSYQYGLSLSQKLSLQMMPVVSALCGASLNAAFLAHYRSLARVHFIVRRLEREHGPLAKEPIESIRKNYFDPHSMT